MDVFVKGPLNRIEYENMNTFGLLFVRARTGNLFIEMGRGIFGKFQGDLLQHTLTTGEVCYLRPECYLS